MRPSNKKIFIFMNLIFIINCLDFIFGLSCLYPRSFSLYNENNILCCEDGIYTYNSNFDELLFFQEFENKIISKEEGGFITFAQFPNNGYVIILLSKHSIQSSWVLHETQFALKLSKKRDNIFPVVIDKEIWKWDKIINYLRLPNEVTEREVLALDMSNYKIKDIPSIIANKLLNIDYDYYIKSKKIIK